jgi:hypothetical protein
VRGDSGFCRDNIMTWCETNGSDYVLELAKNARLKAIIAEELQQAQQQHEATKEAIRDLGETGENRPFGISRILGFALDRPQDKNAFSGLLVRKAGSVTLTLWPSQNYRLCIDLHQPNRNTQICKYGGVTAIADDRISISIPALHGRDTAGACSTNPVKEG